jgi:hypothetical protein
MGGRETEENRPWCYPTMIIVLSSGMRNQAKNGPERSNDPWNSQIVVSTLRMFWVALTDVQQDQAWRSY